MNNLCEANINRKSYRIWYKLNKRTMISVRTPVGMTQKADAGECVSQGSRGAALASGLSISKGIQDYFEDSTDEVSYGRVRCNPQSIVDDVLRGPQH